MAPPRAKQNPPASDSSSKKQSQSRKETDEEEGNPPHSLWVGNLSAETTDADLMSVFAKYGALDSFITYSSRNYAFIYFKNLADVRSAKDELQGHIICGRPIKIEFARPAKPGKLLWVGAVNSSVQKEHLESDFLKFGKIEQFKFLRDRNSAIVDYFKLEDAVSALKNMNGKHFGGEQIYVDYLRSQPMLRESWSDCHETRDGRFSNKKCTAPPDLRMSLDFPESSQFGLKRPSTSQNFGGRRGGGEGPPSNVLWIGYPPSIQVDEQMLHNAMILFGEIERIKSFPSRHYSFVEFRSIDEARRAKEGLQGRLFNDPRIQILFSSSDWAPGKDNPTIYPGIRGPNPDFFLNEPSLRPGSLDLFGHTRPMTPNSFPGQLGSNAILGPNIFMRPFRARGLDPAVAGSEMNDWSSFCHNMADTNLDNKFGANWRRPSPSASSFLPSPLPGMRPPPGPLSGLWDGFDASPLHGEPKRPRFDGPIDDTPFHPRKLERGALGFYGNLHGHIQRSPVGVRASSTEIPGFTGQMGIPDNDHCWRGIIAKGGTPVCRARCIPIGNGIDSQIPEVVNCSARTGLDMLTKHYAEASGFDIVFFLPDSEDDFASYTEFLRYLSMKNRAGVVKFDDGTTLFLVPPSDFLAKVLNVSGPERLYGVVLKMPQQLPNMASQQAQPSVPPHYVDGEHYPPQREYNSDPRKDEQFLQLDYKRALHEGSLPPAGISNAFAAHADESNAVQHAPDFSANQPADSQSGVSLTPELIASLAALIPSNSQSLASATQFSSSISAPVSQPAGDDQLISQGWRQEQQFSGSDNLQNTRQENTNHSYQQMGHQFGSQGNILPQYATYANAAVGNENSAHVALGGSQVQDPAPNMQQIPAGPANSFVASQGGQYAVSQANQPYQFDSLQNAQNYGMTYPADAGGVFRPPPLQQNPSSAQLQNVNLFQPQMGAHLSTDNVNMEFPNQVQVQQLQYALSAGQGAPDGETDKNQRYQSTLQFAASLLLQIQQQQQQQQQPPQANAQTLHVSGNQQ